MRREASSQSPAAFDTAAPTFNDRAPQTAVLLGAPDRGDAEWWRRVEAGPAPLIEPVADGAACVTFLWRDGQGCERTSPIERVYADVNSVTDHHSFTPQSLERIGGTDIWFWQVELPMDWRGTYGFIPADAARRPPAVPSDPHAKDRLQRAWWCSILPLAIADPLNPLTAHTLGRRIPVSPMHLPDAPNYDLWHGIDSGRPLPTGARDLIEIEWVSRVQNKRRKIWIYITGDEQRVVPADGYALVLLLDGSNWVEQTPIHPVLDLETASGRLPPAVYVFIDAIDGDNRNEDLPCNPAFWQAVRDELLPLVADIAPVTADPARSAVIGQSYGGLAAVYAGFCMPDRFGLILSQSGSFWWPNFDALRSSQNQAERRDAARTGWLMKQVEAGIPIPGTPPGNRLRVFMEVGRREDDMIDASDAMDAALGQAGHDVFYRQFEGGHDGLCWRNGLIDGLRWLFAKPSSSEGRSPGKDNSQKRMP
ncbi:enterochelin esterase family protein [Rhizobium sp. PP-F2F-G36]|nr:enterochelin esterase family protein [Rhizobium sp. PP-F2F-G36]